MTRKRGHHDPTLDLICAYLDREGWDTIRSPEFFAYLRDQGIDEATLSIHVCGAGETPLDVAWADEETGGVA